MSIIHADIAQHLQNVFVLDEFGDDFLPYDYAVVKSITEIGHFMGKEIIAEFVENEDILQMLRDIGVDYAQGYAIAKPQSLTTLDGRRSYA